MGVPSPRTPIRVARGTYSVLNTNKAALQEGEVCYATDENSLYVKEGSDLIAQGTASGGTFTGTHTYDSSGNVVINGTLDYNGSGNATFTNLVSESTFWLPNGVGVNMYEQTGNGTNHIFIGPPNSLAANYSLTLPADAGSADEFLTTNGSGTLSWAASSSGAYTQIVTTDTLPTILHYMCDTHAHMGNAIQNNTAFDRTTMPIIDAGDFSLTSSHAAVATTYDGGAFT